ncbi:MAG: DNA polymerase III subunit beta [Pseudomonadota bacterium]|jgi:DNA polymerase-3 subunit beta
MLLVQADKDAILKPLQAVTGIVERKHTLPILSNVLIEITEGRLSFLATDLEVQITSVTTNTDVQHSAAVTISAKKLQDILRALPDGAIISVETKDRRLQLTAGKSAFNLQTLPAEDFPKLALPDGFNAQVRISQKLLKHLFNQVQYAMAQQDIRYYLNGLMLVIEEGSIKVVATDGHRLSLGGIDLDHGQDRREIILPRKTVIEMVKLLSDSDEEVLIDIGRNLVMFSFAGINLVSKIIEGKFPDYNRVIPENYGNHMVIDRLALLQALQRAAILSNERFRGVRLVLTQNNLRIICSNTEQEEAQEEMEITYSGDPLDIGFNVTYLLDVLNNLDSKEVGCSFGDANSSCLITIPGNNHFKYVVMPMRI